MQAGITQDSTMNKLILLFVFDKMETALTEATIIDLCSYKNNWIDYTNCKQALLTLWITASYTKARRWAAETSYSI